MKLMAISGSYRKNGAIETLIERTIEGAMAMNKSIEAETIRLIEKNIQYCRNCMVCKIDEPGKSYTRCTITDDMQELYPRIDEAEAFIFGTPINIGHETAVMKAFLERACWVFSRPGDWPLKGCPEPRSKRKKRAVIIVSSGIVPPLLSRWCDEATPILKDFCQSGLNAKVMGTLYAGAVQTRGIEPYLKQAFRLGEWLML